MTTLEGAVKHSVVIRAAITHHSVSHYDCSRHLVNHYHPGVEEGVVKTGVVCDTIMLFNDCYFYIFLVPNLANTFMYGCLTSYAELNCTLFIVSF